MHSPTDLASPMHLMQVGADARPANPPVSVEDEVRENVLRQPIGDHSVADLALPEAFLHRIADRVIRVSFEQQYRMVVAPRAQPSSSAAPSSQAAARADSASAPSANGLPTYAMWLALALAAACIVWAVRRRKVAP